MHELNLNRFRLQRHLVSDVYDQHHDALVLNPKKELFRFKHEESDGSFVDAPVKLDESDEGYRKVVNIAEDDDSHMCVGTLPVKDEPGSAYLCCYLTNAGRVRFDTPWTEPVAAPPQDLLIVNRAARVFHFEAATSDPTYSQPPKEYADGSPEKQAVSEFLNDGNDNIVAVALCPESLLPGKQLHGYIINTQRMHFLNPWTSAKWNAPPPGERTIMALPDARFVLATADKRLLVISVLGDETLVQELPQPAAYTASQLLSRGMALGEISVESERTILINAQAFNPGRSSSSGPTRLAIAIATGKVIRVVLDGDRATAEEVSVKRNPDVWRLLRNGCVAGRVHLKGESEFTLLVNLSAFSEQPIGPRGGEALTGTWDFKWKAGTELKVLIKRPRDLLATVDFTNVVAEIKRLAEAWTIGTTANLGLTFRSEESVGARTRERYDILVSLDKLPRNRLALSSSDLGSYSRRRDADEPTMRIGWAEGLLDAGGTRIYEADYFASDAFKHIVLHEFGHALGLAHLHQHPGLRDLFKPAEVVMELCKTRLGLELPGPHVQSELKRRWPGSEEFSDWPDDADVDQLFDEQRLLSVTALSNPPIMMGLPVVSAYTDFDVQVIRYPALEAVKYQTELTPIDKAWIRKLYPPAR